MSEPTKTRFTIDLDEIDRQLRKAAAAPAPAPRREPEVEPVFEDIPVSDVGPGYFDAYAAPVALASAPVGGQGADPLRELARIVGQDDPFQSLLGTPSAGSYPAEQMPPQPAGAVGYAWDAGGHDSAAPALGRSAEVGNLADYLRPEGMRGQETPMASSYEHPSYRHQQLPSAEDFGALENLALQNQISAQSQNYAQPESYAQPQDYAPAQDHPQASPAADHAPQSQSYYQPHAGVVYDTTLGGQAHAPEAEYTPSYANPNIGFQPGYHQDDQADAHAGSASGRKWLLRGGVALVVVALGAGAYGFMRSKGVVGRSDPPVVVASTEPTKIAPTVSDGKEFPDQNKQIYQSGAKEGKVQVVNREEQPVDIRQATGAGENPLTNPDNLNDARKVKTLVVTVQGGPVGDTPASAGAPGMAQNQPYVLPQAAAPSATSPIPVRPITPTDAASASASNSQSSTPDQSAQPAAAPLPPPPTPPHRPRMAQPAPTTPTASPAVLPQQVAAAEPPPETQQAAPATRSAGGGYVVQFGTAGSEAAGKTKIAQMKSQYSDALNGVSARVVAGTTASGTAIYRIRSGSMSKQDADTLCNNLKSATSNPQVCFTVRN